jgi:lipooligosaccharide transport system permease protein
MTAAFVGRVVEVNARNYRRTFRGSVISTFVGPVLFLAGMGLGLGTLVKGGGGSSLDGVTYISFIAPGLMAATAMDIASIEGTWPVMASIKWLKTYDAVLATPIAVPDLVLGTLVWIGIRLFSSAVVFAFIAAAFGAIPLVRGFEAVGPAVLTGLAFAAPIMAFTTYCKHESQLSALYRFAIIPMFLFSGTFFPVSQLPGWLQPIAHFTPLWHGVELTRSVALDTPIELNPILHVGYLTIFVAVGLAVATRGLQKRMMP